NIFDEEDSVFLSNFPTENNDYNINKYVYNTWKKIFYIRKKFINLYESVRQLNQLGSTLETKITIVYGKNYNDVFNDVELLNMVLGSWDIKYKLSLEKEDVFNLEISKSKYKKCNRCWRYINNIKNGLCIRCTQVIHQF
ncbi:MAG: hypothetical protein LBM22_00005, partial [Endomicrobium sp.]|nr:hypothetical protein [Endomicrobium sp.]